MSTVFDNKVFDVTKFATHPKCTKTFFDYKTSAGCLFTAFWTGFGFTTTSGDYFYENGDTKRRITADSLADETTVLAESLGLDQFDTWSIIEHYDENNAVLALTELWELIDRLPNKVNHLTVDQVKLPDETCTV